MKVVMLLSGGMDSATLLWHLNAEGHDVQALSINYGQRHHREAEHAIRLAAEADVHLEVLMLPQLSDLLSGSALTAGGPEVPHGHYEDASMQQTVVPNRNMVLLAMAAGYAIAQGGDAVGYGAHAGDHAIYPDCRREFAEAMALALSLCDYKPLHLLAPFISLTKGDIAQRGHDLGVPFELTWTCYEGGELHCGGCGACVERAEAFEEAGIDDPTEWR